MARNENKTGRQLSLEDLEKAGRAFSRSKVSPNFVFASPTQWKQMGEVIFGKDWDTIGDQEAQNDKMIEEFDASN